MPWTEGGWVGVPCGKDHFFEKGWTRALAVFMGWCLVFSLAALLLMSALSTAASVTFSRQTSLLGFLALTLGPAAYKTEAGHREHRFCFPERVVLTSNPTPKRCEKCGSVMLLKLVGAYYRNDVTHYAHIWWCGCGRSEIGPSTRAKTEQERVREEWTQANR